MFPIMPLRSIGRPVLCMLLCISAAGCQMNLLDQMWKMNRQPNMDGGDAYFSVPAETIDDTAGDNVTVLDAPAHKI